MTDIPDIDWINTPHTIAAEFDRLRARLAEVEAERDRLVSLGKQAEQHEAWMNTRLAEVEAEREELLESADALALDAATQRARLAAVEALCDTTDRHPEPNAGMLHTSQVRAAARGVSQPFSPEAKSGGEGDRPAEHRCTAESMGDPESDCWSDPSE